MREFRDGAVWTVSASGFRCERQLFDSVRSRRPKPSNWRPGTGPEDDQVDGDQIPQPQVSGDSSGPVYERFAPDPVSEDPDGVAARFRAIAGSSSEAEQSGAADRLDEALRRLKSERP